MWRQVRPNQWNLYQFIDHAWQYLFTISQVEVDTYISQLQMIGETDGSSGKRRYYRPSHPVLYRPRPPRSSLNVRVELAKRKRSRPSKKRDRER